MLSSIRHRYGSSGSKSNESAKKQSPASSNFVANDHYQSLADHTPATQVLMLANISDGSHGNGARGQANGGTD